MSYILRALKKAEEQRGVALPAVPMLRPLPPDRRARWPWIVGGLVALGAVTGSLALWTLGPRGSQPPSPAATTVAVPAREAPASVPAVAPVPAPPPAPVTPAPASRPERPARPAVSPTGPPASEESTPEPVKRPPPARPAAATAARALDPPVPPPAAEPPSDARPVAAESPVAGPAPVTERPAPPVAARPPVATRPPVVYRPWSTPATAESRATPRSAAPAAAPAPPEAAGGDLRARVAGLTLQVLGWAPDRRDRFVFVNGRKYGEGQVLDGGLLIERITEDGVVLAFQGERITLKSP